MAAVSFPWTIVDGAVLMATTESDAARAMITFAVGTQVAERVMRSAWGVDITDTIWAVGGDLDDAVPEAIERVFTKNFPGYVVHSVDVTRDPSSPYIATVNVTYGLGTSTVDQTVTAQLTLPTSDNGGSS